MQQKPFNLIALLIAAFIFFGSPCFSEPPIGNTIPEIQTYSLEGVQVSFRPEEGKILLILFWDTNSWRADQTATWALDLYRRFHTGGLEILGVCTDSLEEEVMEFSERWKIPWPQIPNAESAVLKRTEQFGVFKTPANIVSDAEGKILARDLKEDDAYGLISKFLGLDAREAEVNPPAVPLAKRDWGAEQAAGAPDTAEAGDFSTAWVSMTADGQDEWLLLYYEAPVQPSTLKIYENHNPGAVNQISVFSTDGKEIPVWQGIDPTPDSQKQGVSEIPIQTELPVTIVKIYLDSKNHPGCNEIDAAGLVDASGQIHWAMDAKASSSFADSIQYDNEDKGYLFPTNRSLVSFAQLDGSHKAVVEMTSAADSSSQPAEQSFRYHVKAFIDGTSVLAIHRNTARWYHSKPALGGLEPENKYPTYINNAEWYPEWSAESGSGWSTIQKQVAPVLPCQAVQVSLKSPKVESSNCATEMNDKTFGFSGMIGQAPKGAIYILQQPSAENDYVLAIAFDDFGLGGSNIYDCYVNVRLAEQETGQALAQSVR